MNEIKLKGKQTYLFISEVLFESSSELNHVEFFKTGKIRLVIHYLNEIANCIHMLFYFNESPHEKGLKVAKLVRVPASHKHHVFLYKGKHMGKMWDEKAYQK